MTLSALSPELTPAEIKEFCTFFCTPREEIYQKGFSPEWVQCMINEGGSRAEDVLKSLLPGAHAVIAIRSAGRVVSATEFLRTRLTQGVEALAEKGYWHHNPSKTMLAMARNLELWRQTCASVKAQKVSAKLIDLLVFKAVGERPFKWFFNSGKLLGLDATLFFYRDQGMWQGRACRKLEMSVHADTLGSSKDALFEAQEPTENFQPIPLNSSATRLILADKGGCIQQNQAICLRARPPQEGKIEMNPIFYRGEPNWENGDENSFAFFCTYDVTLQRKEIFDYATDRSEKIPIGLAPDNPELGQVLDLFEVEREKIVADLTRTKKVQSYTLLLPSTPSQMLQVCTFLLFACVQKPQENGALISYIAAEHLSFLQAQERASLVGKDAGEGAQDIVIEPKKAALFLYGKTLRALQAAPGKESLQENAVKMKPYAEFFEKLCRMTFVLEEGWDASQDIYLVGETLRSKCRSQLTSALEKVPHRKLMLQQLFSWVHSPSSLLQTVDV